MPNPIYSAMNGQTSQMNGFANMVKEFNNFRANFNGDPRQQVQNLLNSGRMTQQQYNELSQMAHQIQRMMR